eukprot:TRINITY_DN1855_c0_g1_i1.p1 TRINITY_DN1855_c0_g1~~TRINITY_DN1855_c0_g1_i1.p1  ORF type:complete len:513 (+),score=159.23 TRINITY_DN1855_c0_g1_i1:227-1540(+)
MEPVYNQVAAALADDTNIAVAKVDGNQEEELNEKYKVKAFPTILLFKNGEWIKTYEGERTVDAFVSYLRKQVGPALKPVKDANALNSLSDIAVVGYFHTNRTFLYQSFANLANDLRDSLDFYVVKEESVAKSLRIDSQGVYLFSNFNGQKKTLQFRGAPSYKSLSEWVWENSIPEVNRFSNLVSNRISKRGFPVLKVITTDENIKKVEGKYLQLLQKLSQEPSLSGIFTFVLTTFEENGGANSLFDLKPAEFQATILDEEEKMKFKYEGDSSYENLKNFAEGFVSQTLKPYLRSAPAPLKQEGDVKVVVGSTFDEIVLDESKDVLLEIYAPWCGHCKNLEPIWKDLGKHLKDVENVVIAKMDGTLNDSPSAAFKVTGFPTILLVPAHNKASPIKFQGSRTVEEFESFLKANTKSWKVKGATEAPAVAEEASSNKEEL